MNISIIPGLDIEKLHTWYTHLVLLLALRGRGDAKSQLRIVSVIFHDTYGRWVLNQNRDPGYPKMDGENNGKTLLKYMIWGVFPYFRKRPDGWVYA